MTGKKKKKKKMPEKVLVNYIKVYLKNETKREKMIKQG